MAPDLEVASTQGPVGSAGPGRPAGSRREQRKSRTREHLLEVASELFVEQGYEQTTFDQIAHRAGVARQTVFNYFGRKEEFVIAWGQARRDQIAGLLRETAAVTDSPVSQLVLTLGAVADYYESNAEAGRVLTLAWVKSGGPVTEERMLADQLAEVLAAGQRAGEVRADLDVGLAGQLVRAAYFDALWAWAGPDRGPDAPSLFTELLTRVELIMTGLCPPGEAPAVARALRLARSLEATRRTR